MRPMGGAFTSTSRWTLLRKHTHSESLRYLIYEYCNERGKCLRDLRRDRESKGHGNNDEDRHNIAEFQRITVTQPRSTCTWLTIAFSLLALRVQWTSQAVPRSASSTSMSCS